MKYLVLTGGVDLQSWPNTCKWYILPRSKVVFTFVSSTNMSPLCCNNCFMGYQWISPFTHKQHSIIMFFLPRLGDSKGGPLPLVFQKFVEPRSIQIQMITEAAEHEAAKS